MTALIERSTSRPDPLVEAVTEMVGERFDIVLGGARQAYLSSNLGKARRSLAMADRLADQLKHRVAEVSHALSIGRNEIEAAERMAPVLLDLRIAVADAEAFVRLTMAEGGR